MRGKGYIMIKLLYILFPSLDGCGVKTMFPYFTAGMTMYFVPLAPVHDMILFSSGLPQFLMTAFLNPSGSSSNHLFVSLNGN